MEELTQGQLLDIMVSTLGESVTDADGKWRTTGSQSRRNFLNHAEIGETIINRVLNLYSSKFVGLTTSVEGFAERITTLIGDENNSPDRETFLSIGSNLIQAVANLQQQVESNPGYEPTPSGVITEQDIDDIFDTVFN
jgi:hypothetical protein